MREIPKMTGLQFLVLHVLFDGAKTGRELREALAGHGAGMNPSAFTQLMQRLERARLVQGEPASSVVGERTVRCRLYQATIGGLKRWREVRAYYGGFSEPGEIEDGLFDEVAYAAETEAFKTRLVELGLQIAAKPGR